MALSLFPSHWLPRDGILFSGWSFIDVLQKCAMWSDCLDGVQHLLRRSYHLHMSILTGSQGLNICIPQQGLVRGDGEPPYIQAILYLHVSINVYLGVL